MSASIEAALLQPIFFLLAVRKRVEPRLDGAEIFPVELGDLLHPVAPVGQELGKNTRRLFILSQS